MDRTPEKSDVTTRGHPGHRNARGGFGFLPTDKEVCKNCDSLDTLDRVAFTTYARSGSSMWTMSFAARDSSTILPTPFSLPSYARGSLERPFLQTNQRLNGKFDCAAFASISRGKSKRALFAAEPIVRRQSRVTECNGR